MSDQQRDLFETEPAPWEVDDQSEILLATVVFAAAPRGEFDYRVPDSLRDRVKPGCRLHVPLGRSNRKIVAYCVDVRAAKTGTRRLKDVTGVQDEIPLISPPILQMTRWMADYYVCPLGMILETVVPASVRGAAGTRNATLLHVPTGVAARITQLKLPRKQAEALKYLAAAPAPLSPSDLALAVRCTSAPINALRKKGLVHEERRRVHTGDFAAQPAPRTKPLQLNADQQKALAEITDQLNQGTHHTFLLHGITGSGKTEVYIQAIEKLIHFGRQAIVLVPEISLTPQTHRRFQSRLDNVAVLHSHLSTAERHWQWQRIAKGEVQVVVGARSAIFGRRPSWG